MSAEPTPKTLAAVGAADRAIAAMVAALAEADPELSGAYAYRIDLGRTDGTKDEPLIYETDIPPWG